MIRMVSLSALYLVLAAAPASARTIEVEITQQAKNAARVTQKLVLEVGDARCSGVQIRAGKTSQTVKVCPDKNGFGLELHLADADLEAHAPATVGQRTVVGRFERLDGSSLEVATTPR